jgi:hypothetical protein
MRKRKKQIVPQAFCLGFAFTISCTFGSVGDSDQERLQSLQNLILLRNNQTTILSTSLQAFDNQSDDNISLFEISSGGNLYSISIASDSYFQWETAFYRINPDGRILGVFNVKSNESSSISRTHTPFTLPLDLPTTDIYGKNYVFLNSGIERNFTRNSSSNDTGSIFVSSFTKPVIDSPIGIVSLATISWEQIYLNITITRNSISKTVKILLGQGIINLKPKCKLKVESNRQIPVSIGFQYSNLFRDYIDKGLTVSFVQNVFAKTGNEIIVTSISNEDLLLNLNRNLNTEDLVINFPGCVPGVEK